MIDLAFIQEYYAFFLKGTLISLQIAFFSCLMGTILGIMVGVILAYKIRVLYPCARLYVIVIRGTPMLIQIAATYYFLIYLGFALSAFWSAIISIGLNSGAYVSQIVMAGINSVGQGQSEAAKTLGFTNIQIVRYIVLPQAIATVLPALGNELITLVKDSSLASTIGVYELTQQGKFIMSQTYNAPAVYMMMGVIYLTLTTLISGVVSILEKRMQSHVKY